MVEIRVKTVACESGTLGEDVLNDFRSRIRGTVILPSDAGYADARQIWNAMIDRKPGLIAQCTGTDDVMQAVRAKCARSASIPIAPTDGRCTAFAVVPGLYIQSP